MVRFAQFLDVGTDLLSDENTSTSCVEESFVGNFMVHVGWKTLFFLF